MLKNAFLGLMLCLSMVSMAQERKMDPRITYANTIMPSDLRKHLEVLASDEYEGRETGQKGQKMAARYIAGVFKAFGVGHAGLPDGYFQSFELTETSWGNTWITSGNEELYSFGKDFYGFLSSNKTFESTTGEVVFLGYGIDDPKYSDYAGIDVQGKVLVVLGGEPKDKDGNYRISGNDTPSDWTTEWRIKGATASRMGAACIMVVDSKFDARMENAYFLDYIQHSTLELPTDNTEDDGANVLYISSGMAAALLGQEKMDKAIAKMTKKGKPVNFAVNKPLSFTIQRKTQPVYTENVLGFIPGTDLKDEVIAVTAHYDHIGKDGDEVYNGADDDGSGTVALLEIAQAMSIARMEGNGPRRSILIMGFTGEEKGLLGSEYYAENPVFPLENTVANLNIDMIGRIDKDHINDTNYVYIIGSDFLSTELHAINEYNAKTYTDLSLDYRYNSTDDPNRFYYRSDHYNFAKNNVPVIFFFNGTHEDYHQATDEVDKINYEILAKRTQLVFYDLWTLANMDKRIEVDVIQE